MLSINVVLEELFDEQTNTFQPGRSVCLELEHSLVSLSKWESRFRKPFLSTPDRTREETIGYVEAMLLTPDVPPEVLLKINQDNVDQIVEYIQNPMTATWVTENPNSPPSREIITSELIYYWMISMQIPFECQYWHLNRLLMLIKVCVHKNAPKKKMSPKDLAARNRSLNAQRLAAMKTTG
mgnify:CR=1 FL=1